MKFLKTMFLICIVVQINAQSFEWSNSTLNHDICQFDTKPPTILRTMLKTSDNQYGRLTYNTCKGQSFPKLRLDHFDENMKLVASENIVYTERSSSAVKAIVNATDKFYVFHSVYDNVEKTNTLYAQAIDVNGEKVGAEKLISQYSNLSGFKIGAFFIETSADNSHIAILSVPPFEKKTNETVAVKVFNADLETVTDQEMAFDFPRKRIYFNTPFVDNNGTFYMYKIRKDKKTKTSIHTIYTISANADKFETLDIEGDGIYGFYKSLNKRNGNAVLAGLSKEYNPFYMEFDAAGKLIKTVNGEFEGRIPNIVVGTNFDIQDVILAKNDDIIITATVKSVRTETTPDNQTTTSTFGQNNFYTARLNEEGTVWTKLITRGELKSNNDYGRYLGGVTHYDAASDVLTIVYNNLIKHYDEEAQNGNFKIPVVATITADGEVNKKALLNAGVGVLKTKEGKPKDTHIFSPDESYVFGNQFFVKCANDNNIKIGVLKW